LNNFLPKNSIKWKIGATIFDIVCKAQFHGDNFLILKPKGENYWVLSNLCHWEFNKKSSKNSKNKIFNACGRCHLSSEIQSQPFTFKVKFYWIFTLDNELKRGSSGHSYLARHQVLVPKMVLTPSCAKLTNPFHKDPVKL
jgi:hypothetical protein